MRKLEYAKAINEIEKVPSSFAVAEYAVSRLEKATFSPIGLVIFPVIVTWLGSVFVQAKSIVANTIVVRFFKFIFLVFLLLNINFFWYKSTYVSTIFNDLP